MFIQESIFDIAERKDDNLIGNVTSTSINTVNGYVKLKSINKILIHEHVFNRYPYRFRNESEQFTINALSKAYAAGVDTIVDLTPYTNIYNYYKVIDESPINIICCIGFYTPRFVPSSIRNLTEDDLLKMYCKKIEKGIGSRHIKPGILKIAAQKEVLGENEKKFFKVISKLSMHYDLPVALHAPFNAAEHALRLLDYGVKPTKLMVAHIENGICKESVLNARINEAAELCGLGVFVQLADFGASANSKKHKSTFTLLSGLVERGFKKQILMSSDSNWHWEKGVPKLRGETLGAGRDYTYILKDALVSVRKVIRDADMLLFRDNPLTFLGCGDL